MLLPWNYIYFITSEENDVCLQFFDKVMRCHSNRDAVEQFKEKSEEVESPEQVCFINTYAHVLAIINF